MISPRALPQSRLAATVHMHQRGYAGQKVKINVKEGGKVAETLGRIRMLVEQLLQQGEPVVAIERSRDNPFIATARRQVSGIRTRDGMIFTP